MKLIILAGENNSGKTTILKALTTALQLKGAKSLKLTPVGNSDEDAEYELYYCGHKVVICTLGDYSENLNNHCEQYKVEYSWINMYQLKPEPRFNIFSMSKMMGIYV